MGRPRNVSTNEILQSSMMLFWEQGYDNTSYDDIIKVTGTSRYGLYHEFGGKEQLFNSTLDFYTEQVIMERMKPLVANGAALKDIKLFFDNLIRDTISVEKRIGCLLCNSMVYEAKHYDAIKTQTDRISAMMQSVFQNVIENGVNMGRIQKEALEDGLDGMLMAQLISLNVISPQSDSVDLLRFIGKGVNRLLNSYKT